MFTISTGLISAPARAVFYGTEGIGKSTFATWAPAPVFLDLELGTKHLDVARIGGVNGWSHIEKLVTHLRDQLRAGTCPYRTLVVDTVDWAEKLAVQHLCVEHNQNGLEGFGWGRGFTYLQEMFERLLKQIDLLVEEGMHVIFLAHAHTRKQEDPGKAGSYDRYELKLTKQVSPIIREWADLVVFMNYSTVLTEGQRGNVAVGGQERTIYMQHNAAWDAKNRHGLPESGPMVWETIAPAFSYVPAPKDKPKPTITLHQPPTPQKGDDLGEHSELEAIPAPKETPEAASEPKETPEEVDPLTEPDPEEPASQVQITNCQNLWTKCCETLGYDAAKLTEMWKFYDLPGKAAMWSQLTKANAATVIGFLTSKLEIGAQQ